MKTIAHVGTLKNSTDQMFNLMALEWLCRKDISYLNDIQVKHHDINLKWNQDYLLDTNEYNIVMLHFLFRDSHIISKSIKNDFHSGSDIHSQENWNKKLNNSKADYIFCFGNDTEVTSLWFGSLDNYEMEVETYGLKGRMEVHRRIK